MREYYSNSINHCSVIGRYFVFNLIVLLLYGTCFSQNIYPVKMPRSRHEFYPIRARIMEELLSKIGKLPDYGEINNSVQMIIREPDIKIVSKPAVAVLVYSSNKKDEFASCLSRRLLSCGYAIVEVGNIVDFSGAGQLRLTLNKITSSNKYNRSEIVIIGWGDSCRSAVAIGACDFRVEGLVLIEPPEDIKKYLPLIAPRRLMIVSKKGLDVEWKSYNYIGGLYQVFLSGGNFQITKKSADAVVFWLGKTKQPLYVRGKVTPEADPAIVKKFPLPRYECIKTSRAPVIDGDLSDDVWKEVPWTDYFRDIATGADAKFKTRAKMLWDDRYLYIAIEMEDRDIRAREMNRDSVMLDDDIEVFIDPDGDGRDYLDFEMNAKGDIFDGVVERTGGTTFLSWNARGFKKGIKYQGTFNTHNDRDKGWTLEWAFPWSTLSDFAGGRNCPPKNGDVWRLDFFRMIYHRKIIDRSYVVDKSKVPMMWTWSVHGHGSMHDSSRFGRVIFVDTRKGWKEL